MSTEGQEQTVEAEGRDACEQVRTLGAAAATRAFIWCGCSLLLDASEPTSAHSGVRMVCSKVPLKGDMELEMSTFRGGKQQRNNPLQLKPIVKAYVLQCVWLLCYQH